MNISNIPFSERESLLEPLQQWVRGNEHYKWLLGNDRQKVTSVSLGTVPPLETPQITVPVTITSNTAGYYVNVIIYYGENDTVTFAGLLAEWVLPKLYWEPAKPMLRGKPLFGVKHLAQITNLNQTVHVPLPVIRNWRNGGTLPFFVYVTENTAFERYDSFFAGIADIQSEFTFKDFSFPILNP